MVASDPRPCRRLSCRAGRRRACDRDALRIPSSVVDSVKRPRHSVGCCYAVERSGHGGRLGNPGACRLRGCLLRVASLSCLERSYDGETAARGAARSELDGVVDGRARRIRIPVSRLLAVVFGVDAELDVDDIRIAVRLAGTRERSLAKQMTDEKAEAEHVGQQAGDE